MSLDPLLLDVLACPVDKGPLLWFEDEDVLYNPRLQKSYAVVDGVPGAAGGRGGRRRRRRARAADGQGRERRGAGHRAGVGVSEPGYLDTLGMWEAAAALPEQLSGALETAQATRSAGRPARAAAPFRAVAAFGLGTGGAAGRGGGRPQCAPICRCPSGWATGPPVPAFVGADTLVFAVSCSGGTAETLAAAAEAVAAGRTVVAVGGGPVEPLARLAGEAGLPVVPGAPGRRGARAPRLGAATVPLLVALARAGLVPDSHRRGRRGGRGVGPPPRRVRGPGRRRPKLARRIGRTIPLVYGSAGVAAVAAHWWKAQVNLNAKAPAFAATCPS